MFYYVLQKDSQKLAPLSETTLCPRLLCLPSLFHMLLDLIKCIELVPISRDNTLTRWCVHWVSETWEKMLCEHQKMNYKVSITLAFKHESHQIKLESNAHRVKVEQANLIRRQSRKISQILHGSRLVTLNLVCLCWLPLSWYLKEVMQNVKHPSHLGKHTRHKTITKVHPHVTWHYKSKSKCQFIPTLHVKSEHKSTCKSYQFTSSPAPLKNSKLLLSGKFVKLFFFWGGVGGLVNQ